MKRFSRCVFAVAIAAAGVTGVQQQPAAAQGPAVLTGSGSMASASGPGTSANAVSGTISGTVIGTFGSCGFTGAFNGLESIIQGQGVGSPFGCFPGGPCQVHYVRNLTQIQMAGPCTASGPFQASGFVEPNSVVPTTSYNFQVAGHHSIFGPFVINGNMAFTPGAILGVSTGTLLPVNTAVTLSGTITGLIGPGLSVGSCGLSMTGGGSESITTGSSGLSGVCNSPWGPMNCFMQWSHLATHAAISGACSASFGSQQFGGMGELVLGDGGGYSLDAVLLFI